MRGLAGVCAAAVMALGAHSAQAVVLLSDNFDAEAVPASGAALNYNHFANFFVADGTVDLLGTPNPYGLVGSGAFVDLDGSTGDAGYLETIAQYDFDAGDTVTLTFLASGNQRGGSADNIFGGFRFFTPVTFSNVTFTGFTAFTEPPGGLLLGTGALATGDPYATYSISFTAGTAGTLTALLGTGGGDNVGPLVDNVSLAAIPEPATWSLMILGLGAAGGVLRAHRRLAAI